MVRQDPSTEPAPMRPIPTLAPLLLRCAPCLFATACASGEWVELPGHRYQVETADTHAHRAPGLIVTAALPAGHRMRFITARPVTQPRPRARAVGVQGGRT